MNIAIFILKVFLLSTGLSLAIKYLAPSFTIAATPANALIAVFSPTLIMLMLFSWKAWKQQG
ncbi:hypothetical protein [Egbenema bharatensis]|uniref:hypothetical protein n=1 Tax=Egbenema bharatensis TaxID=3463334 RepID=UPI003A8C77CE